MAPKRCVKRLNDEHRLPGRLMRNSSISARNETALFDVGAGVGGSSCNMPSFSVITRQKLNWHPSGPGLIVDLDQMDYSQV